MKLQNVISNLIKVKFFALTILLLVGFSTNAQKTATLTDDINSKGGSYDSGTSANLKIKGDNLEKEIFLKFTIPSGINYIHSIELELRSGSASVTDIDVYKSNVLASSWSESNISSGNEPTPDQLVSTSAELPMSGGGQQAVWQLDKSYFTSGEIVSLVVIRDAANQTEISFIAKTSNNQPILRCYTCDDGVQNGDETGIDCGGSCPSNCGGGGGNTPPVAGFTYTISGSTVTFDNTSTDPDSDPLTYMWDFGDTNMDTVEDPIHTYSSDGMYMVSLTANDGTTTNTYTETIDISTGGGGGGTGAWTQGANGIHYIGNVGIGAVASSSEALVVKGEVYAQRVRVKTTAGADFVFEKDYELMPLNIVEAYIKKHKHLPEIPSEQEMIDNDLQLGDFSIQLLQKVEELTLYMIELKKQNELLQQENQEIRKELKALKEK